MYIHHADHPPSFKMKLSLQIFFFCCFQGTCWTSDNYCVYQPRSVHVKENNSVTIPCSYTYAEELRGISQIMLKWGERDGENCINIKKFFTDNSGNIIDEYKDQISIVNHPDNRTSSLIIQGLKVSDGITFCCTATMFSNRYQPFTLSDQYGTSVAFSDEISQVEELMAVPGEEMVIPCHYPLKTLGGAKQVTWYSGDNVLCAHNLNKIFSWDSIHTGDIYLYSLVNFPEDVSLRMHRVRRNEYRHFCCHVTTSNGTIHSTYGTELTIADSRSTPPFSVTQLYTITGKIEESVTLNCSYSSYMKRDLLSVNIYWRVDSLSGPYVYHPYKEMVHPSYRGRTEIRGAADLHIQGLNMSDVSTYYCFVMIRVCTGDDKYIKQIQYGEGTRLIMTDPAQSHLHPAVILFCYIGCKFCISLVLLILALVYYRNKLYKYT